MWSPRNWLASDRPCPLETEPLTQRRRWLAGLRHSPVKPRKKTISEIRNRTRMPVQGLNRCRAGDGRGHLFPSYPTFRKRVVSKYFTFHCKRQPSRPGGAGQIFMQNIPFDCPLIPSGPSETHNTRLRPFRPRKVPISPDMNNGCIIIHSFRVNIKIC